jgi:hypothetical protein
MSCFRLLGLIALLVGSGGALADPLDSCKEQPRRAGERHFECDGFSLSAAVEQPAFAEQGQLDVLANGLGQEKRFHVERVEVAVGGQSRPGIRYSSAGKAGVWGVAVLIPAGSEKIRTIVCEERKRSRCDAALSPFALKIQGDRPPEAIPAADVASEPRFAGRSISVGEGCTFKSDGPKSIIHCGPANVSWVNVSPEDPQGFDWVYQPMKKALSTQGTLTEKQLPCLVDGTKAACKDLEISRPNGSTWHATAVMAKVRDQRVWVQCNVSGDRGKDLPAPCSELLKFE